MKKILGLFLVILISSVSVSVFAQNKDNNRHGKRDMDPTKRMEKMVEYLKLDDKQTAEFKRINEEFHQKMKANRDANKADREAMKANREKNHETMLAMRNDRNEEMKKVLSDEQYKKFIEKQEPRKGHKHNKGSMHKKDRKEKELK